jgi:hypothetical protein
MRYALLLAAAASLSAAPSSAQSLADRVAAVRDGVVRMTFESRPDVCTDGNGSTWTRNSYNDGYRPCVHSPVRVSLGRAEGRTVSVRTQLGGRWSPASSEVDLGNVPSKDAALYLISLVRSMAGRNADDALSAAVFADDFDLAPPLREIVVDENAPLESRKRALFWLGQSDLPSRDLAALYEQLSPYSLREQFTFVASQRRDDESLTKLMDIARHDHDSQIRKQAMFWLGQSKDPRVTKFFRDLLTP